MVARADRGVDWKFPRVHAQRETARETRGRIRVSRAQRTSHLAGTEYALAKTLQNWRGVVARADGTVVSANMAPGSRTASMRHVKTVAVGLEGQKHFAPLTAFDADVASALMANLLLYDLGCETSSARPEWGRARKTLDDETGGEDEPREWDEGRHPMDVFGETAAHGGTWRCAWRVDSIGRASYVAGTLWG